MGLAAPDLVEYLVRQPLRFGHSRRIRWIHLAGGMLFVTLALFGLIPEDGDFPSGTLYQPILSYVHIGFFLLLGILGLALGWRLNWKLLLHAEGLEIDPAWGDPLHISWDQIANVRRRWHAEVRITTQKGRRVAFYGRFGRRGTGGLPVRGGLDRPAGALQWPRADRRPAQRGPKDHADLQVPCAGQT